MKNPLYLAEVDGGIDEASEVIESFLQQGIPLYILSSGNIHSPKYCGLISRVGKQRVHASPCLSKIDPNSYTRMLTEWGLIAGETFYIDDNPIALNMAKAAGIQTGMMTNQVFGREGLGSERLYIDRIFNSWQEVRDFISR